MKFTRREALITASAAAVAASMPRGVHALAEAPNADDPALKDVVSISDMQAIAQQRMEHMAWEYISGAAADEITLRWNREAYDRIRLNPRVLRDVSEIDTKVKVLGQELPFPIMLSPTALHKLAHPSGELATAQGASAAKTAMTLSTMSSCLLEDVIKETSQPMFFQLYVQRDRGFTAELVKRAVAAGYKALAVTVDTPVDGARNRQARAKFHLPEGVDLANLRGLKSVASIKAASEKDVFKAFLPSKLTWKDVEWLQSLSNLPVLLKGVLNADDADIAARSGIAGVWVSNHGARNLDTVPATIDALPRITDKVAGRITVLVDGGVRRGTDVLKALAMGANAVLMGRPIFYGLATAGAAGVTKAISILQTEFQLAMALSGVTRIAEIDRKVLWDA